MEIRSKVMPASDWDFAKHESRSAKFWEQRLGPKYPSEKPDHPLGSGDFLQEDIYVCEQQQKSFQSPWFELGPSASHGESPVREHQKVVWKYLKKHAGHLVAKNSVGKAE